VQQCCAHLASTDSCTHSTNTHLHPKLRQMRALQLLVITKAYRPIRSYRLISIHGWTTLLVKPELYGVGRWTGGGQDGQRSVTSRSRNHCCRGKVVLHVLCVAIIIQHAMRMRRITLSSVDCLPVTYFYTYIWHDFREMLLNIKCVFWFSLQLLSETFLVLRTIEREMIKNVLRSSYKVPVKLVRFQWNLNFLDKFSEKSSDFKFNENPASGSRVPCGPADRRTANKTDITKLTVVFRTF
jgi:hypothetical protein